MNFGPSIKITKMEITTDKIYEIIESLNSGSTIDVQPEALLKTIEKCFSKGDKIEHIHCQNFLHFVVEQYTFFAGIKNLFTRVKELCTILINSKELSSKVTGITSQTKLWILSYKENQGIEHFINYLYTNAADSNMNNLDNPPYLRSIYSQCLLELYYANPKLINYSYEQIIEASNSTFIPTEFPELAFSMKGESKEIEEYFKSRWWSFSPLETAVFSPSYVPPFPAVPNDPLLLHIAMEKKLVPQDTALSLINSPFSQFGVQSVLLGFKDSYKVDGDSLFTPFDSNELIAAKSQLLPPTIQSIEANPNLVDFISQDSNDSIVEAVFRIASRLGPQDLFLFFQKYFEKTPQFDEHWIQVYSIQQPQIQATLQCFLQQFPTRNASNIILLNSPSPSITSISNVNKDNYKELAPLLKNATTLSGTYQSAYAAEKLHSLLTSEIGEDVKQSIQTKTTSNTQLDLMNDEQVYVSKSPLFKIDVMNINTNNIICTTINLIFAFDDKADPTLDGKIPFYGVTFALSNDEYFSNEGVATVPQITDFAELRFKMKPKKAGNCFLACTCSFTTKDGQYVQCQLGNVKVTIDMFLSPPNDPEALKTENEEESRIVVPIPFDDFEAKISTCVFGRVAQRENCSLKAVVITPEVFTITLDAKGIENVTSVTFKAPTLELISLIDEFINNLVFSQ